MIQCPKWLKDEAAEFWRRHFARLVSAGIIEESDAEGFALLCDVYRQLRTINPDTDSRAAMRYNSLLKSWLMLGKQYGLLPRDRKRSGIEPEADLDDVLGRKMERR